jgi:hypothetical protein
LQKAPLGASSPNGYSKHGGALLLNRRGIIKAHELLRQRLCVTLHQAAAFIDGDVVNIIRKSIETMPMPNNLNGFIPL